MEKQAEKETLKIKQFKLRIELNHKRAEAYRYAMVQAKESPELIRQAEEIKLRAERRAGEILRNMEKHPGTVLGGNIVQPPSKLSKLEDLGINKTQSSRWQLEASIPEEEFENYIETGEELTTAGAVRLADENK